MTNWIRNMFIYFHAQLFKEYLNDVLATFQLILTSEVCFASMLVYRDKPNTCLFQRFTGGFRDATWYKYPICSFEETTSTSVRSFQSAMNWNLICKGSTSQKCCGRISVISSRCLMLRAALLWSYTRDVDHCKLTPTLPFTASLFNKLVAENRIE